MPKTRPGLVGSFLKNNQQPGLGLTGNFLKMTNNQAWISWQLSKE